MFPIYANTCMPIANLVPLSHSSASPQSTYNRPAMSAHPAATPQRVREGPRDWRVQYPPWVVGLIEVAHPAGCRPAMICEYIRSTRSVNRSGVCARPPTPTSSRWRGIGLGRMRWPSAPGLNQSLPDTTGMVVSGYAGHRHTASPPRPLGKPERYCALK
jgi:hypothetical protein